MIQRIQTVYFLLALGLLLAFMFLPYSSLNSDNQTLVIKVFSIPASGFNFNGQIGNTVVAFFSGMGSVLIIFSIFLYRNRTKQHRIALTGAIVLLLTEAGLAYTLLLGLNGHVISTMKFSSFFPLISAILVYLALRAIKKDDELVKSYDRLR